MKRVLVILIFSLLSVWLSPSSATPTDSCQHKNIRKTFASGALWDICWTIETIEGLTVSQVHFKAPDTPYRKVLGQASLSQIQSTFDNGNTSPSFLTTEKGLGGNNTQTLNQQACPNGKLHTIDGKNVMCSHTIPKGYLYKYNSQQQTEAFELISYSQINSQYYQLRWTFYENGTIEPSIGLSTPFSESTETNEGSTSSFVNHYFWRLDFDLGPSHNNDAIQEISSIPSTNRLKKYKTISTLQLETAKSLNPDHKTFWRVIDKSTSDPEAKYASYEIIPSHFDQSGMNNLNQDWLTHDIYFTQYKSCEQHLIKNPINNCTGNISQFINNNQSIKNADIVVWYRQSLHHHPDSEENNRTTMNQSSFQLFPRDWNTKNPY